MWTIGRTSHHDWTLSDDKIHMSLTIVELFELLTRLGFILDALTYRECQETIRTLDRIAPRKIRGDLIFADPDDPNQFIIRIHGRMPDADHGRKVEYRIGIQDAGDIMLAMVRAIDREAGDVLKDYECEDPDMNYALKLGFVVFDDLKRIRLNVH